MTAATDEIRVLRALRAAGDRGVALYVLRERLGGRNAQPTLDALISSGHSVVRCPDERGRPLAILIERERIGDPA